MAQKRSFGEGADVCVRRPMRRQPRRQPTVDAGMPATQCPPDPRIALHAQGYGDITTTRAQTMPRGFYAAGRVLPFSRSS